MRSTPQLVKAIRRAGRATQATGRQSVRSHSTRNATRWSAWQHATWIDRIFLNDSGDDYLDIHCPHSMQ